MNIAELLALRGLDIHAKIKLVRHQEARYDIVELYRAGHLETYQSYQAKPVFDKCSFVVSFMGLERARAQFIGVYSVNGSKPAEEVTLPPDFPYPNMLSGGSLFYDLHALEGFDDLKDRVIIDWGNSTRTWHQWLDENEKDVIEILPKGYVKDFPGYLDFVVTFDELVAISRNPVANREWYRMLSAAAGIYLIVDSATGMQYVGSAYGQNGIWGRWAQYAQSGHGGNAKLKALLATDAHYARYFRFTILHTLPDTMTKGEVIAWEIKYKSKLGTKAFGLNSN